MTKHLQYLRTVRKQNQVMKKINALSTMLAEGGDNIRDHERDYATKEINRLYGTLTDC